MQNNIKLYLNHVIFRLKLKSCHMLRHTCNVGKKFATHEKIHNNISNNKECGL